MHNLGHLYNAVMSTAPAAGPQGLLVGEQITLLKPHQVPLMHHMSHLFNAVMFTAPAPAGGRAINTAQATYHE